MRYCYLLILLNSPHILCKLFKTCFKFSNYSNTEHTTAWIVGLCVYFVSE